MKDVLLGGMGGIVAYMFDYSRQKKQLEEVKWSNGAMFINMVIGAFVAYSLATFIPIDTSGRDGIVGFIGVSSYAILGIVESRFAKLILDRFIGGNNGRM
jgi:hypothetical protein